MRTFGAFVTTISGFLPVGTEFTMTVPTGHIYTILGFELQLLAFPVAANRVVRVALIDGSGNTMGIWGSGVIQGSGASFLYTGPASAMGESDPVATGTIMIPMPWQLTLAAGMGLKTATRNLQANDQYTAANVFVEDNAS